ncbi:MAG: S8 family serine peptidase [Saprospiraceae bacterium]|nr:S8 family serine peptidase [Pyrinomonadaceae bacterium]
MNRNNIWIHIGLAVVLITMAGILGQIQRWKTSLRSVTETKEVIKTAPKPASLNRSKKDSDPEVMVRFRPGVSLSQIKKIILRNNDRLDDETESVSGLVSIDDLDSVDAETVAKQYANLKDLVEYAEPVFEVSHGEQIQDPSYLDLARRELESDEDLPNDPQFADQWALNNLGRDGGKERADIDAIKAWLKSKGSQEVVVAVLDSGVDYNHPDLVANMWTRPDNIPQYTDDELGSFNDIQGFDADVNAGDPMDDNGHGTHCAGIIGAEGNNNEGIAGINWNVQIMPLKFMGRGGFGTTANAIEAINYAIDRKQKGVNVRVISASWGSTSKSRALEDAIRAAGEQGILFVAAAGNASTNNDSRPHYPSNYNLPNVISVAATDKTDALASFSNFGIKTVHIAAPGRDILSTWLGGDYREASGTSMATPYVAGVAALILASEPDLTVEQLRERLLKSVDKIDSLAGKVENGGRLNASKALGN